MYNAFRIDQKEKVSPLAGLLYFYVHFVTEVVCFFMLGRYGGDSLMLWFVPLLYDMLAFIPQSLIGYACDKLPRLQVGVPGLALMSVALLVWNTGLFRSPIPSLVILCLGNACTHVAGAEVTLRTAKGRLGPSAVFVAGGSFGVITGTLLAKTAVPFWILILLAATAVPFVLLAEDERRKADAQREVPCADFIDALEIVSIPLSDVSSSFVKLTFSAGQLLFESNSTIGEGKEYIKVPYTDDEISLSFNPQLLADPFKHVNVDKVNIKINEGFNPIAIETTDGFLYVIMPIRNK